MNTIRVQRTSSSLKGSIHLPYSKSISNRALLLKALFPGDVSINKLSKANDTLLLQHLLDRIQNNIGKTDAVQLDCANAGTVFRFLTAFLSITPGTWILSGSDRMKKRPVKDLVNALSNLGADITFLEKSGFPPLKINGTQLSGECVEIDGGTSSQFISALLLISPKLTQGLTLNISGKIRSRPYIQMTISMLKQIGMNVEITGNVIRILPKTVSSRLFMIESDWSSAAFWYELVAFATDADILLENLTRKSMQGDAILPEIFEDLGVNSRFEENGVRLTKNGKKIDEFHYDFTNHPDLAQPVIAACAGLGIKGTFTGLESLRIKETDRIAAMLTELDKLGFMCSTGNQADTLHTIYMGKSRCNVKDLFSEKNVHSIHPYGDHRMAMAFAPFVLLFESIKIQNPEVVSKSYPTFWEDLKKSGINISSSTH